MRILTALLLCLATTLVTNGYAQEEELKQLEIVQSICASAVSNPADSRQTNLNHLPNLSMGEASPMALALNLNLDLALDLNLNLDLKAKRVQKFETYAVRIDFFDGYRFHVANYYDGTCIVTCLDGPLLGYQVISVHGVVTAESSNVIWRKDHFVHRYKNGKVFTYERMQVIELK